MKPYKKVFKEAIESLEVDSERKAKQFVDISNLVWSEDTQQITWNDAMSSCPPGWRLPTVQELYTAMTVQDLRTAFNMNIPVFQSKNYWSSNTYTTKDTISFPWCVNFGNGGAQPYAKTMNYYVRYVKTINPSYEDKIENLLFKHLKQNYNKSPKEIEAIEYFISSVLDDLEYTEFTMVEANKMLMLCKRFLGIK